MVIGKRAWGTLVASILSCSAATKCQRRLAPAGSHIVAEPHLQLPCLVPNSCQTQHMKRCSEQRMGWIFSLLEKSHGWAKQLSNGRLTGRAAQLPRRLRSSGVIPEYSLASAKHATRHSLSPRVFKTVHLRHAFSATTNSSVQQRLWLLALVDLRCSLRCCSA